MGYGNLREEWKFPYLAEQVGEAARAKASQHRERESWWKLELTRAETDLKENGLQHRDVPVTGGNRAEVVLDPTKQRRVQECREKIADHSVKAIEYEGYARALSLNADATIELLVSDIVFFGL